MIDILETAEFLDIPLVSSLCQEWLEVRMTTDNQRGGDLEDCNLSCGGRRCGRDSWSEWGTTTGTWWMEEMMETIRFGLLEPGFFLRRVLPKT